MAVRLRGRDCQEKSITDWIMIQQSGTVRHGGEVAVNALVDGARRQSSGGLEAVGLDISHVNDSERRTKRARNRSGIACVTRAVASVTRAVRCGRHHGNENHRNSPRK
jgi:hypothetical protein